MTIDGEKNFQLILLSPTFSYTQSDSSTVVRLLLASKYNNFYGLISIDMSIYLDSINLIYFSLHLSLKSLLARFNVESADSLIRK